MEEVENIKTDRLEKSRYMVVNEVLCSFKKDAEIYYNAYKRELDKDPYSEDTAYFRTKCYTVIGVYCRILRRIGYVGEINWP